MYVSVKMFHQLSVREAGVRLQDHEILAEREHGMKPAKLTLMKNLLLASIIIIVTMYIVWLMILWNLIVHMLIGWSFKCLDDVI